MQSKVSKSLLLVQNKPWEQLSVKTNIHRMKSPRSAPQPSVLENHDQKLARNYKLMNQELQGKTTKLPTESNCRPSKPSVSNGNTATLESFGIHEISAAGMHLNMQQKENTFFVCTLDEVDAELRSRSINSIS